MSTPRDHHFIPVFYLKKWRNSERKVVEYSRPYPGKFKVKTVGPRGTGYQPDLYSFPNLPPGLAQFLEAEFLQRSDHLASVVLNKFLNGTTEPWDSASRSAWSRFLSHFLMRHPHPFAEIKAVAHDCWLQPDDITQKEYEKLKRPEDPPTFEDWVLQQKDNLSDRIRVRLIQGVMDNETLGSRLNAMQWTVIDLWNAKFRLLTSDWPLYREISTPRLLFALPISPTKLFIAYNHPDILRQIKSDSPDRLARKMNLNVVSGARLYVYACDNSQDSFVHSTMSSNMKQPPFFPSLQGPLLKN